MLKNAEHRLVTTSLRQADEVIPDWRNILNFDQDDRRVLEAICTILNSKGKSIVLVGRAKIANYLASEFAALECKVLAADYGLELPEEFLSKVRNEMPKDNAQIVFICEYDRLNARKLSELISPLEVLNFDVLLEDANVIPLSGWTKRYEHIYPIEIPDVQLRSNLDALILDTPARSIAQLPIGFAYVYKALKTSSISMQAVDLDIIAYHRYHQRRSLNNWEHVIDGDLVHPEDPWQPVNYLFWMEDKTVSYFAEYLDEIAEKIIQAKPRVLGFSLHQTSTRFIDVITSKVMPYLPDTVVVVGGMSCYQSNVASKVFPKADYVIIGESETVVVPLFEALARGERPFDIPGVVSKYDSENRKYVGAPLPHNLDNLGAPDYSFTNLSLYKNWNGYTLIPIVGSRGCGWSRCTFCAERFNWRARTPELVAEEIEGFTKLGFFNFVFNESDFNSNHEFVKRLCNNIIERKLDIRLMAQLRISKASDQEYFNLLKKAGFNSLRFGVDAFSENTLKLQRKGYTLETVRKNLEYCFNAGIYVEINAVIGVPGETEEDLRQSADFLISLGNRLGRVAYINALMLYVSSVYYNEPEKFNIHFNSDKEELYKKYVVSFPDDSWYSTEPFIDYKERRRRFIWLVEELRKGGVPLGDFAEWTVKIQEKGKGLPHVGVEQKNDASELLSDEPSSLPPRAQAELEGPGVINLINGRYFRSGPVESTVSSLEVYSRDPELLREYREYNLVALNGEIIAARKDMGSLDLRDPVHKQNLKIIRGKTEKEVCAIIDYVYAANSREMSRARSIIRAVRHRSPSFVWDRLT